MRNLTFFLMILLLGASACSQKVILEIQDNNVLFKEGKDTILVYQTADKALNGQYKRSNYIHPLYTLDGQILTEDFPEDHLHHRGVFWAWHQLYVGDQRIGDGWEIKDFSWEVLHVDALETNGPTKTIQSKVFWKSPLWLSKDGKEQPLVSERTMITVYPSNKQYRQIDIEISLTAMEPDMRIGGSQDPKGYGGFSPRIRLADQMVFNSPNGTVTPQNLPIQAGAWMDISGPLGRKGATAGLAIFPDKDNPGYPNPWILRSKNSMQNAVYPHPGAQAVPLSQVKPTTLRYRLIIHNGLNSAEISALQEQY